MDEGLYEIIKKRQTPGVLIFDWDNRLLYSNKKALETLSGFEEIVRSKEEGKIPIEIFNLCNELKRNAKVAGQGADFNWAVVGNKSGPPCSARAFFIGGHRDQNTGHIIVLVERVIEKHEMDREHVKSKFKLTKRELEVVGLICDGQSNREISERLFISEFTVKDHIKKIMEKMGVRSRALIIASLNKNPL